MQSSIQQTEMTARMADPANAMLMPARVLQFVQGAAYVVVVAWGIRLASDMLAVVLLGILLGYSFLPLGRWFMSRLKGRKTAAIAFSLTVVAATQLLIGFYAWKAAVEVKSKLPEYKEHVSRTYGQVEGFLNNRGIRVGDLESNEHSWSDLIFDTVKKMLPQLRRFVSELALTFLLGFVFLAEMLRKEGEEKTFLSQRLAYYGAEMEAYVMITAKKGVITSLANFVLLAVIGVDFAVLWALLSFVLGFIPNLGFLVTLVAPTLLALVSLGWKQAVLVAAGLLLINLWSDYVLNPRLMKEAVDVSFREILLSLMVWGFLLGAAGGILAIPMTLAVRKFAQSLARPVMEPAILAR